MVVRVAVNGFGRIGRMVLRSGIDDKNIEFVAINDLTDAKTLAYLLKYDSAQGKFDKPVKAVKNSLVINGKTIPVFAEKDPHNLPWRKLKVDVVCESTGLFLTKKSAGAHLHAGAKKVVVSAPCKCESHDGVCLPGEKVKTIVLGVNQEQYNKKTDDVISNASCTTNCAAPVIKVLNDVFGVKKGFLTTIHSYTATQKIVDGPNKKDPRRGRAAAVNIVPTTTGAAEAVGEVLPELFGKLDGMAMRVPIVNGSLTDFTIEVKQKVTVDQVNKAFKEAAKKGMKNIIQCSDEPLVSTDIIGNPYSAIFDLDSTKVIGGNLVKVLAWYDNEWGFSKRMIDAIKLMMK